MLLGVAVGVGTAAFATWQAEWISADGGAIVLACTALLSAAVATPLLRRTHVEPAEATPPGP